MTHTRGQEDRASRPMAPSRHSVIVDIDHPMRTERPLSTTTKTTTALHDPPAPVKAKLAAAWTSFMFLYIYVDYLHLYKPGAIDDILAGVVFEFDISQTFVVISLMLVGIPIFMVL